MTQTLKVGDRVKILMAHDDADKIGEIRRVVSIDRGNVFLEGCRSPFDNPTDYLQLITTSSSGRRFV